MAKKRVRIEYIDGDFCCGSYAVVHYYWGWFPIKVREGNDRADCYRIMTAYNRLLRIRAIRKLKITRRSGDKYHGYERKI